MSLYNQSTERFLYMYVTSACGLRCKHCYVGNERLNKSEYFSLELANEVLEYFKVTGAHDKLYILGGEPTMHPDLDKIVYSAREKGYSITISTNGDFSEEIFDKIPPSQLSSINFSIESANPDIHRKIRGRKDNFDKVSHNIKRASELGYQVRTMCTVNELNAPDAFDLIPYLAELGAHTLSYHNLGLTGNATKFLKPLSPKKWIEFCHELESLEPHPTLAVYYPPTFIDASEQKKYAERGYPGCPARTFDRPHIYPDGSVYLCPLFMDGERHFARFKDGQLIINPAQNNEINAYFKMDKTCGGCQFSTTCGGGCPAYSNMDTYKEADWYSCDKKTTPICILWTTYAWEKKPVESIHEFR